MGLQATTQDIIDILQNSQVTDFSIFGGNAKKSCESRD
jgi:hypothetical protein